MHGNTDSRDHDQVHDKLQRVPKHAHNLDAAVANSDASASSNIQNQSNQRGRNQDTTYDL